MVNAIAVQTAQAACLSALSNIIAQYFTAIQAQVFNSSLHSPKNNSLADPSQNNVSFSLELAPLAKYVTYGILNTPLNCLWQEYLEHKFPAQQPAAVKGKQKKRKPVKKSSKWRNTAVKFGLDQTVGAAGNIAFFALTHGLLNGASMAEITQSIIQVRKAVPWDMSKKNKRNINHSNFQDSWSIYISGLMIWPLVSFISFVLLPVERRVLFGSAAGVAWGVYLSLVAMGSKTGETASHQH